jgi:hypothetical protein
METRTAQRLDAQDQQIKQLQSDLSAMKTSWEADRLENSEFRKVVLDMLKKAEKGPILASPDSGIFSSDGGSGSSNGSGSHGIPPRGVPWAVKKIKLPEFTGFDPQGWIQKAKLYFDINKRQTTFVSD